MERGGWVEGGEDGWRGDDGWREGRMGVEVFSDFDVGEIGK